MGYFLRGAHIGPQNIIEIDGVRYEILANARKTLVDAGAFEQRYELLLGNFTAFEMFCAEVSLRGTFELESRYEKWAEVLSEANRYTINFLTTARLFADHVVRDFNHLVLQEPFADVAKRLLSKAYDETLGYQFVCELRNHVQHRAVAVHGIKGRPKGASWPEKSMIYCRKQLIMDDKGSFKMRVLDQLNEDIDLLTMFRAYMVSINQVQLALRKIVRLACIESREAIELAMKDYASAQNGSGAATGRVIGLTAVKGEVGNFSDPILLILDWDDARVAWGDKNSRAIALPEV
ncbi:hypothetical protein NG825_00680 [Xanthomonas sacchari]|uniref:hypothetical protein n=1 Tax=Xanthomonas sacchari TaxID=56458 RepID=UPI0022518E15|nr:hypothetical protein [Xanthomonas sacchari]MCW0454674.1 hypothetical protein [Xanthomonas sacchari]UYK76960.1 hypothetical protein NG825_00680 [Xanthomonas sacchari]